MATYYPTSSPFAPPGSVPLGGTSPMSPFAAPGQLPLGAPGFGTQAVGNFPAPAAAGGGSHPYSGGQYDQNAIRAWVQSFGVPDVDYWVRRILETDGLSGANTDYWTQFITTRQNPSGPESGGASPVGLGQFLQPYPGTFTPPQGTDDPGFRFALDEGLDAIQRSAAAKGNLLTGGTLKDLTKYATGAALQDYAGAFNRALQTFGTNYDVFRNNQNDPFARLLSVTGLGANAASAFGNNTSALSTGAGNVNAAGTIGAANALNPAITAFNNWYQPFRLGPPTGLPAPNPNAGFGFNIHGD